MNDLAAIGSMRAAHEAGLSVPGDLSVVGVDDVPLCAYLPLTLSSIRQRYRMITQNAAELLLARIGNDPSLPTEPQQVVVPTLFVPRESIGRAPGA
jgi:LacI family transcriptional regulator